MDLLHIWTHCSLSLGLSVDTTLNDLDHWMTLTLDLEISKSGTLLIASSILYGFASYLDTMFHSTMLFSGYNI